MARVIYGGGVSEFIGSIGGTTFQSNNSGTIARNKPQIKKSRTASQVSQLVDFSNLSQLYRQLDLADRQQWVNYSAAHNHTTYWGNERVITGINWHQIINNEFIKQGTSPVNSPPTYVAPVVSSDFSLNIGAGTLTLNAAIPFGSASQYMVLCLFPPLRSNSIIPRKSAIFVTKLIDSNISTLDISSDWEAATGLSITNTINEPDNTTIVGVSLVNDNCPIPSQLKFNS